MTDGFLAIERWERAQKEAGRQVSVRPNAVPLAGDALEEAARFAAVAAYRESLPVLTGRRRAQAYIACIAAGVQLGYLTKDDLKSLFYAAQMALQAHGKRSRDAGSRRKKPQPTPIGEVVVSGFSGEGRR